MHTINGQSNRYHGTQGVFNVMKAARSNALSRRTILGTTAAATLGAGTVLVGTSTAAAARGRAGDGPQASGSFKVVDRRGTQRFLAASRKPPVILGGKTYPAELRQGPDDASYLIFNDDHGNERGGIVASVEGAQVSLDYPNMQGITLIATAAGKQGRAKLIMVEAPDADLPVEQITSVPRRVELGWDSQKGSVLELNDSKGRPRIRLQVGADDVPRIQVLDGYGSVVEQLPR